MCFYSDDDGWSAEVVEEQSKIAETDCKCHECGNAIIKGSWYTTEYARELDACAVCDEFGEQYDEDNPQDPATCQHDYGMECTWNCCVPCAKVLAAIYEVESEEGCPEWSRQPTKFAMRDELAEHGDAAIYIARALKMFPEIYLHKVVKEVLEDSEHLLDYSI